MTIWPTISQVRVDSEYRLSVSLICIDVSFGIYRVTECIVYLDKEGIGDYHQAESRYKDRYSHHTDLYHNLLN